MRKRSRRKLKCVPTKIKHLFTIIANDLLRIDRGFRISLFLNDNIYFYIEIVSSIQIAEGNDIIYKVSTIEVSYQNTCHIYIAIKSFKKYDKITHKFYVKGRAKLRSLIKVLNKVHDILTKIQNLFL